MAKLPFITPSSVPTASKSRCLIFPDSREWKALINGFIGMGTDPKNWQQLDGGIPVDEAVSACVQILNQFFQDEICGEATLVIGEYKMLSHNNVPEGWLTCRGGVLEQADYPELYAVIGGLYNSGGEGSTQFRLPDFSHRSPMGAPSNEYTGAIGGNMTQTLITPNLPPHTHQQTNNVPLAAYRHTGTGGANASMAFTNGTTNSTQELRTQSTGGGEPFSIIHPVRYVNVIIYAGR